ncbi:ankyrin repeat domain-containing protein [Actibacterium ureilyticum]|uniref:ankyrin repeat domain-containing protein n=1 Tax=Actibacterium ureilyticum TaxID=1590614 RepID=UPI000BAAB4D3|nr:ankyrin repeat domain-containing protein [Actibacterium ureilyticum]
MMDDLTGQIYNAAREGDVAELERLKSGIPALSDKNTHPNFCDIVDACPIDSIRWLLDNGADPNMKTDDGFPPLHCAIDRDTPDRAEVLKLLLDNGADVNQRGFNDWTPLHRAAVVRPTQEIMALLMDRGADRDARTGIDHHATPAEEAVHLGHQLSAIFINDYRPG